MMRENLADVGNDKIEDSRRAACQCRQTATIELIRRDRIHLNNDIITK